VFVGRDETGKERFASMRGISGDLKRDVPDSDKRFSFLLPPKTIACTDLAVFESPIDAMSHAALTERGYSTWDGYRLSLGGTSALALTAFLKRNIQIERVALCLDADGAGRMATQNVQKMLLTDKRFSHITVDDKPPENCKDYNEVLVHAIAQERRQTRDDKNHGSFSL